MKGRGRGRKKEGRREEGEGGRRGRREEGRGELTALSTLAALLNARALAAVPTGTYGAVAALAYTYAAAVALAGVPAIAVRATLAVG